MFDVAFSEILIIALVALIVIGPEKLPRVARTVGHLTGRLQRYVNNVKVDIERELRAEELRGLQQHVSGELKAADSAVRDGLHQIADAGELPEDGQPPPKDTDQIR